MAFASQSARHTQLRGVCAAEGAWMNPLSSCLPCSRTLSRASHSSRLHERAFWIWYWCPITKEIAPISGWTTCLVRDHRIAIFHSSTSVHSCCLFLFLPCARGSTSFTRQGLWSEALGIWLIVFPPGGYVCSTWSIILLHSSVLCGAQQQGQRREFHFLLREREN